jgi:hypothetical protein
MPPRISPSFGGHRHIPRFDEHLAVGRSLEDDRHMFGVSDEEAEGVRKWLDQHLFDHVLSRGGDSAGFGDSQDVWVGDGTLVRLTRDRGQWSCDLSRSGSDVWLDVDRIAAAMGLDSTVPVQRVAELVGSMNDRVFRVLSATLPHSP